jgi:hypothetical protein
LLGVLTVFLKTILAFFTVFYLYVALEGEWFMYGERGEGGVSCKILVKGMIGQGEESNLRPTELETN